jgi:hypothetical protein
VVDFEGRAIGMGRLALCRASVVALAIATVPLEARAGDGKGDANFSGNPSAYGNPNDLLLLQPLLPPGISDAIDTFAIVNDPMLPNYVQQFFGDLLNPDTTINTILQLPYSKIQSFIDKTIATGGAAYGTPNTNLDNEILNFVDNTVPNLIKTFSNNITKSIQNEINHK